MKKTFTPGQIRLYSDEDHVRLFYLVLRETQRAFDLVIIGEPRIYSGLLKVRYDHLPALDPEEWVAPP